MKINKRNSVMIKTVKDITNKNNTGYYNTGATHEKIPADSRQETINKMQRIVNDELYSINNERNYVKRIINWLEDKDQRLCKAENILFEISKLAKQSMRKTNPYCEHTITQNDINSLINEFDSFMKRYISAEEAMGQILDDNVSSMISCDALKKLNNCNFSVDLTDDKNSLGKTISELNSTIKMVRKNQFELESCIDFLHHKYDKSYVKETNLLASLSSISHSDQIEEELELILCGMNS